MTTIDVMTWIWSFYRIRKFIQFQGIILHWICVLLILEATVPAQVNVQVLIEMR